jgi:hypothetical protein
VAPANPHQTRANPNNVKKIYIIPCKPQGAP